MRSRKGIELINRFAQRPPDASSGAPSSPSASLPTAPATRPSSGASSRPSSPRGELLAVAATNALELGIDIGELDAAICAGFPGTVASLRQMWGRAGRRSRGLAVYMAGEDALDQFFCRHPHEFLERPVEAAILDHRNEQIHAQHLIAAAHEAPLGPEDEAFFGEGIEEAGERPGRRRRAAAGPRRPSDPAQVRVPRRADLAALGVGRLGRRDRRRLGRDARPGRVRARLLDRAPRRDLPPPRPHPTRSASSTSRAAARSSASASTPTSTPRPRRRPTSGSRGRSRARKALGVELSFGSVSVSEKVIAFQRKRLSDHA